MGMLPCLGKQFSLGPVDIMSERKKKERKTLLGGLILFSSFSLKVIITY